MGDEVVGAGHGAIASDDDDGVEVVPGECVETVLGSVFEDGFSVGVVPDGEPERVCLVGGAEDGSSEGEYSGDIAGGERSDAVFDESEEAVFDSEDLPSVIEDCRFGDCSDDGVEAGAVASSGEDADAFGVGGHGGSIDGRGWNG